jgi:hypothetical protein
MVVVHFKTYILARDFRKFPLRDEATLIVKGKLKLSGLRGSRKDYDVGLFKDGLNFCVRDDRSDKGSSVFESLALRFSGLNRGHENKETSKSCSNGSTENYRIKHSRIPFLID